MKRPAAAITATAVHDASSSAVPVHDASSSTVAAHDASSSTVAAHEARSSTVAAHEASSSTVASTAVNACKGKGKTEVLYQAARHATGNNVEPVMGNDTWRGRSTKCCMCLCNVWATGQCVGRCVARPHCVSFPTAVNALIASIMTPLRQTLDFENALFGCDSDESDDL
jgi:hypothetical protein